MSTISSWESTDMREIVIDTLLGDKGETETVLGAVLAKKAHPDYQMVLVGIKDNILNILKENGEDASEYEIVDSKPLDHSVTNPMALLRYKEHSSLMDMYGYLFSHEEAAGALSTGPTGMVIIGAKVTHGLLDGVEFPSLAAILKSYNGKNVCLVDCGANIDITSHRLLQFAKQGVALMRAHDCIAEPRVGLLNIGSEEYKGNALCKEAFPMFKESNMNFVGNIEGNDVFLDKADVVATDGFAGNIILKNAEAVGLISKGLVESIDKTDENIQKAGKLLFKMFGYTDQGGAILLGTKKPIIKPHGASNRKGIAAAIDILITLDQHHFTEDMSKELATMAKNEVE